jgi:hypothetical protein
MVADGLEPALLAEDKETTLSELGYSGLCIFSSCLFAVAMLHWERYFYSFPTQPLYAAAVVSSLEVFFLPLVVMLDMIPFVGFAGSAQDALASFETFHRRVVDLPSSAFTAIVAHALLAMLVVPFVARCPSLTVPIFCAIPLALAGAVPSGGAILVIVGGAYCFFLIMLLFVEDAAYESGGEHRLCRLVNCQVKTLAWRHGCSVVTWVPKVPDATSEHPPTRGPSLLVVLLQLMGLAPISASEMGVVTFSNRAFAARFSNDWRGVSYERLPAVNVDE